MKRIIILLVFIPSLAFSKECEIFKRLETARRVIELLGIMNALEHNIQSVKQCPNSTSALLSAMQLLFEAGEFLSVIKSCELLSQIDELRDKNLLTCAMAYSAMGERDKARVLFDRYIVGEDRLERIFDVAEVLEKTARFDIAVQYLEIGYKLFPDNHNLIKRYITMLLKASRYKECEEIAQSILKRMKEEAPTLAREIVKIMMEFGQLSLAKHIVWYMISLPNLTLEDLDIIVTIAHAVNNPNLSMKAADRYIQMNKDKEGKRCIYDAVHILERRGEIQPSVIVLSNAISSGSLAEVDAYLYLGRLYLKNGKVDEADKAFQMIIKAGGHGSVMQVAEQFMAAGLPSLAVDTIRNHIRIEEMTLEQVLYLGKALFEAGDLEGEMEEYRRFASNVKDKADFWMTVGSAILEREDAPRALMAFDEALKHTNNPVQKGLILTRKSRCYLLQNDKRKAEESIMKAIEAGGNNEKVSVEVQKIVESMNVKPDLYISVLKGKINNDPDNPENYFALAKAYLSVNKKVEAFVTMIEGIELSQDKGKHCAEMIRLLIEAKLGRKAGILAKRCGVSVKPLEAEAIARACLEEGDFGCATIYIRDFLKTPYLENYDYLSLARLLRKSRLLSEASIALEYARRLTPRDSQIDIDIETALVALYKGENRKDLFSKVFNESNNKKNIAIRIAEDLKESGYLSLSAEWYKKAILESDPLTGFQLFVKWAENLLKIGEYDELRKEIKGMVIPDKPNPQLEKALVVLLYEAGLFEETYVLIDKLRKRDKGLEQLPLKLIMAKTALKLHKDDMFLVISEELCTSGDMEHNDCEEMARIAYRALRNDLAMEVLKKCGTGFCVYLKAVIHAEKGEIHNAVMTILEGGNDRIDEDILKYIGDTFVMSHHYEEYLELLNVIKERSGAKPFILFEIGRVLCLLDKVDDALQVFETYIQKEKGGGAKVFKLLYSEKLYLAAFKFLTDAPSKEIAEWKVEDLEEISNALVRLGRTDLLSQLFEKYLKGNESIQASLEVIGRVYSDLGWWEESYNSFKKVERLSSSGVLSFFWVLWEMGRKGEALDLIIKTFPLIPESEKKWLLPEMMGLLLSETLSKDMIKLVQDIDISHENFYKKARVLALGGEKQLIERAYDLFIEKLATEETISQDAEKFILSEISFGRGHQLLNRIRKFIHEPVGLAAQILILCLSNQPEELAKVLRLIPSLSFTNKEKLLIAKILFDRGKWQDVVSMLKGMIGTHHPEQIPLEVAKLYVLASRLTGNPNALEEIEAKYSESIEDRMELESRLAELRLAVGDYKGYAIMRYNIAKRKPNDIRELTKAMESALWARDERLRKQIENELFSKAEDLRLIEEQLQFLYESYVYPEYAYDIGYTNYRNDAVALMADFRMAVSAGMYEEAEALAEKWMAVTRKKALPDIVKISANAFAEGIVQKYLPQLLTIKGNHASLSILDASIMYMRLSKYDVAEALVKKAIENAPDKSTIVMTLASIAIKDPSVPTHLFKYLPNTEEIKDAPELLGVRCLEDNQECGIGKGVIPFDVLISLANRMLLEHKFDKALGFFRSANHIYPRGKLTIARKIAFYSGFFEEEIQDSYRSIFGRFAYELVSDKIENKVFEDLSLKAQIETLINGREKGQRVYEESISLYPSEAVYHNNLGWMLSLMGGDMKRAVKEARLASVLSPEGNAYYIETESWAWFIGGEKKVALEHQEKARALWNVSLSGGLSDSFYHLGRIYESLGMKTKALESYRKCMQLEPFEWASREALKRYLMLQQKN